MTFTYPSIALDVAALACLIALVIGMAIGGAIFNKSDRRP